MGIVVQNFSTTRKPFIYKGFSHYSPYVRQIKIISNLEILLKNISFIRFSTKIKLGFCFTSSRNPFVNPTALK